MPETISPSTDEEAIVALTDPGLLEYVCKRLSGQEPHPLLNTRTDEELQTVFFRCASMDLQFRNRLSKVLEQIVWDAERSDPEPNCFSRVLDLVESLKPIRVRPHLVCLLIQNRPFFGTHEGLYKIDLRLHIMMALLAIHDEADPVDWRSFITEPKYAATAFFGLLRRGLDEAMEDFPDLVRRAAADPSSIPLRSILLHISHRWPKDEIVRKVFIAGRVLLRDARVFLLDETSKIRSLSAIATTFRDILELDEMQEFTPAPATANFRQIQIFLKPKFSPTLCET